MIIGHRHETAPPTNHLSKALLQVAKDKSSKVNKNWLHDHINDPYVKLAQKEGYRARAVYKLKEIDETHHLFDHAQVVVDLGAAPGAWSQYLSRRLHAGAAAPEPTQQALLVGLDLLPMEPVAGVQFIQGDFQSDAVLAELEQVLDGRAVDVVVSDMAPNLSGHASTDGARVQNLIEIAVDFARQHLKRDGAMVAKVFHGPGYEQIVQLFREVFRESKPIKPKASRSRSAEVFLLGRGLR